MKKIAAVLICMVMMIYITACNDPQSGDMPKSKRVVSIATVQPENHPISVGLRAMKSYIEQELDGVEVKIYYNGIMGDNSQALELLQMGTLNLVATSGSNLESFNNTYKIFGLPYLFDDEDNFRKCMNTPEFVDVVYNCTKEKGLQGVAWFANGVNNIYSTKPVHTPDDVKGMKLRIQASEANVMLAEGWGAAATVLAYGEVYTALQNHVIDAAMNPEMALISMKHGEVAQYYSYTEHQIFTDMLIANVGFLDTLSDEERMVFEEAFDIATSTECEEWDYQIQECKRNAEEIGVQFITVDKAPFEKMQEPVKVKLLKENPELQSLYGIVRNLQEGT